MEMGTATLGMMVALAPQEEEHDHDHEGDGEDQGELHVLHGGADGRGPVGQGGDLDGGGQGGLELGQEALDAVHHRDDVGPGLALDIYDDGGRLVHPRRELDVFDAVDDVGHVGQPHGGAVLVGDDDLLVLVTRQELIVRPDGEGLPRPLEIALRLIDVGLPEDDAQVFEAEPVGGERGGVGLHADGGPLTAADRDEPHPGELGNLLGEVRVGEILHAAQGQRVRGEGEGEDRRIGGVDLAVDGRIGQVPGKVGGGDIDRRLDLLLGHVDGMLKGELERDEGGAEGAGGRHLIETGELAELALERRGH